MSITILVILVLFSFCVMYLAVVQHKTKQEGINRVEAGPVNGVEIGTHNQKSDIHFSIWDDFNTPEGKSIDKSKFRTIEVEGACMYPIDIHDKDILFYEFMPNFCNFLFNEGDLIVLEIYDKKKGLIRKIRVINKILSDAVEGRCLETYYFKEKEGKWYRKKSSINHKINQVVGIVRYKKA